MGCMERGGEAEVFIETESSLGLGFHDELEKDAFLVDILPLKAPFINLPSLFVFWKVVK
jgi:hypothetical protein